MSDTAYVLLIGVTGMLGHGIAQRLLESNAAVRALIRRGGYEDDKRRKIEGLVAQGLQVVEGDINEPASLPAACSGVDVIVSAVQGDARVIVDGQLNLLKAAEKAGVARMIPSDFAIDIFKLDYGDNVNLDLRKRANEAFAGSPVKPTSVLNGAFIDVMVNPMLGVVDWERGTFSYWGDGEQPCDFTSVADTARYTAAAVLDAGVAGRPVRIAGEVLSMNEFHAALERGSKRRLAKRCLGTVEDLRRTIDEKKRTAANPWDWISLQYNWCMVSGKGKLDPLDNERYPHIRPVGVESYVRGAYGKEEA